MDERVSVGQGRFLGARVALPVNMPEGLFTRRAASCPPGAAETAALPGKGRGGGLIL